MKIKIIFIDTNIYLDFYRPSESSLDTLTAIAKLVEEKKVELILPKQVISEFMRDKEIVFVDFVEQNFRKMKDPGFIDKKQVKRLNNLLNKIKDDYQKKFFSPRSNINTGIKELFDLAVIPEETNDLLDLAYYRTRRGNPPRKNNNSFGDAIIWETILMNSSDKDLVIISRDGDFSSEVNKNEIHPFLKEEWSQKNNKKIILMDSLGELINSVTEKETIKKEAIQEEKKYGELYNINGFNLGIKNVTASGIINNTEQNYIGNRAGASLLGIRVCECCGKDIDSFSMSNRCNDCRSKVSVFCEKCNRPFYSNSLTITGRYVCPDCSGNKICSIK